MSEPLRVPLLDGSSAIAFFPDELPDDYVDVIDVLRSEIAPLKSWRLCAVEYFRIGDFDGYDSILGEIEKALHDPELEAHYQERADFEESLTEIFVSLAARQLIALSLLKSSGAPAEQISQITNKCIDFIKRADEKVRTHEYLHVLKGFFEIIQGDAKRAEGCFRYVYERAAKAQNATRKKFLFASLIGLGIVSFTQNRVKVALDYFSKAITANPSCDASIRTALACCCFKLEQYDRAKLALAKAATLHADAEQLVMWALLKLVDANKDRANRVAHRRSAFEFAYLAHSLDPYNAAAVNLLANHRFHAWQSLDGFRGVQLLDSTTLFVEAELLASAGWAPGNQLRVAGADEDSLHIITQVVPATGGDETGDLHSEVHFLPPVGKHLVAAFPATGLRFQLRNFGEVADLARRALGLTTIKDIRAESFYLLGKVAHAQGDRSAAYELYGKALSEAPGLALAAFGAAQIMFASKEFDKALELFEDVLKVNPDDHDSLAYAALLRGMVKSEASPLEKLREYATGFQFDVDLWVSQAQLRHRRPEQADYSAALRCYSHALDCMRARKVSPSPALLGNMGVLFHTVGKRERALECFSEALVAQLHSRPRPPSTVWFNAPEIGRLVHRPADAPLCLVRRAADSATGAAVFEVDGPAVDLEDLLLPGGLVVVGDWLWEVVSVNQGVLEVTASLRPGPAAVTDDPEPLRVVPGADLLADDLVCMTFNVARALEDLGHTSAAVELYARILTKHPSTLDCYLRLSCCAKSMGQLETAAAWLVRAQLCKEDAVELSVGLADALLALGRGEEAKKALEKAYVKHNKDPQLLVAQANYYYSAFGAADKADEKHLRLAYKFFYPVLQQHVRNALAANGLAIVCAEKRENDAAREIFNKIREVHGHAQADDACLNLAHVHAEEGRPLDAERLYLAALKTTSRSSAGTAEQAAQLLECIADAQARHGRDADARRTMLRALHLNPLGASLLQNTAALFEKRADEADLAPRGAKVGEHASLQLSEQLRHVQLAEKLLAWSASGTALRLMKADPSVKKAAVQRAAHCEAARKRLAAQLKAVQSNEAKFADQRRRVEEEHQERLREREEQRIREEAMRDDERARVQELAQRQARRLEEMSDRWATQHSDPTATAAQGDGANPKKRGRKGTKDEATTAATAAEGADGVDELFPDDDEDDDERPAAPRGAGGDELGLEDSDDEAAAPAKRPREEPAEA